MGMSKSTKQVQWASNGNLLDGKPGDVLRLLASADGVTFGYGGGPGASMVFGTESGSDITVYPGQWVTRHPDGSITVTDTQF